MTDAETNIVFYLFMVLFGLIVVNLVINTCLYIVTRIENIRTLTFYWLSLLLTYVIQGQFQEGEMGIMLSFGANILPCLLISKLLMESLQRKFPLKKYLALWALGALASAALKSWDWPFAISALPLCAALALALAEPGLLAIFSSKKTTALKKFTGIMYVIGAIHVINFALFRIEPGAQIWGWSVALGLYQVLSISLFAFAFEEYSLQENARLQALVTHRTEELNQTLLMKENLFKVVLHDIANPVHGQLWILKRAEKEQALSPESLKKLKRLTNMVKEVIQMVRSIETIKCGRLNIELVPVDLQKSLDDLYSIFEEPLKQKNLRLKISNKLPPGSFILADQNTFTTSVMCNLISNSIKFSESDRELRISAYLREGKVVLEVEDQGIGIPREMALSIFDPAKARSRPGTMGERGTGYGMPLVKSFVDHFGGEIEIESRPITEDPIHHGTKVTITLEQA